MGVAAAFELEDQEGFKHHLRTGCGCVEQSWHHHWKEEELRREGTLKKNTPRAEKELHTIIDNELDALEEGPSLLKYEFSLTKGGPDFLCVDSGGRLVIIEVKLHEDENILFQALRYYAEIDGQRYAIATMFPDRGIDPAQDPRVILIAGRFSDSIRKLSTLVIPEVEIYEFAVLAPRRKSFDFAAAMVEQGAHGGEYETVRIETAHEDYTDIVERVKISFRNMDAVAETEA